LDTTGKLFFLLKTFFSPNRQKVKHKSISYAAAVEIKALKGRKKFVRQGDNFYTQVMV